MNCSQVRALLPLLLYGDLADTEAAALRRHLQACPGCGKEEQALRQVRSLLDTMPAPSVVIDTAQVYRLAAERERRRARRWRRLASCAAAAAAVVFLAVILRVEIRLEAHQVSLRWGAPAAPPQPDPVAAPLPPTPPPVVPNLEVADAKVREQVEVLNELLNGQQDELTRLHGWIAELQRQLTASARQWRTTERDVAALAGNPSLSPGKGGSP